LKAAAIWVPNPELPLDGGIGGSGGI